MELSTEDKKLIRQIQGDLPPSLTPFAVLARRLGREEKELLRRIGALKRRGMIRRFGAILRHQIAGYHGNAMVVWKIPEDRIADVARVMASDPAVSHCYLRPPVAAWPYNLYTMIHGPSEKDCLLAARRIARKAQGGEFRLLFSQREHKKSSMRYFENTRVRGSKGPRAQAERKKKQP